ncbi:MAG: site-specific integrase [Desulfobacterales bacterium]|nr:site-specific integrase [Desulfobacterales bacterium]
MGLWKDRVRKHWRYGFQYQGQRYTGRGFRTKKEAAAAEAQKRKQLKKRPITTGMGYLTACNLYLDISEKAHAVKTFKYKKYVYVSFAKFLGVTSPDDDIPIENITSQMITEYLKTRPSNHNFNVHRKDLSAMFEYAVDTLEVINRNPIKKIKKLPHDSAKKVIPKEEDIIKLLLAADPKTDEKDLLTVLLHTIARIDEILRLTWDDVNFKKRVLTKWTKKTHDHNYKAVPVTINAELYETLQRMWEKRKQDTWVFYNEKTGNRYMHRPKFMKGLCKRAGVEPYFGFHTLRHYMASLLNDNPKVGTQTIQKILGHSEIRTTEIYLHSLDGQIEGAMDSLSGVFSESSDPLQTKKST